MSYSETQMPTTNFKQTSHTTSLKNKSKQKILLLETWKPISFSLDAGYVYAPYVPLEIREELNEPESFSVNKKVRSIYSTSSVSSSFYSTVNIAQ